MNKRLSVLTILLPLAILGAILPGQVIPRAHAAGAGLVCIPQVTDSICPMGLAPTFNGPLTTPNSLLRVPVWINNTDPFLGYDITINSSDITKLKPYGADFTGTIMPAGSITLAECIGGVRVLGSTCAPTDNPTTIRVAVVGPFGFLSQQGATGLLFTAIFSIVGTTLPGGVKINYQNGCTGSPTSNGSFCVTLTNGTVSPVPEALRGAGFDNSDTTTLPYATLTTPTTNLGQSLVGAPTHALPTVTYTAASQNGFSSTSTATLSLAATINGTGTRPTVSLSTSLIDLTGVATQTFTQSGSVASTVPVGVFIATVTATYQSQDMLSFTTSSLSAGYPLVVNVTDYTVNASPNPVTVQPAGSQPVTVTIAPKASFNTLVKLGITIPGATASAGIGATFNSYTISGGAGTSTLTVTTTTSTPAASYTLTITSNATLSGFTKTHTITLTIKAGGFTITATTPASQNTGTSETSTITVAFINGFTGTVTFSSNTVPNLSCTAISPTSVTANGTATVSCNSLLASSYTLTVTGTSGSVSRSTTITFTFTAGFSISASSTTASIVGTSEVSTITVTYLNGFTGTVTLADNTVTNLSCGAISPASVSATGTATVSCNSAIAGVYTLTIMGTSGLVTVSTTATFTFTPGFLISATTPPPTNLATAATSTITVTFVTGFSGTVTLTSNTIPNLTCLAISPLSFTANGTATLSCLSTVAGTYMLSVTATSGPNSLSATITFTFSVLSHDVAITNYSVNPSGQVTVGKNVTVTVQLQNKGTVTEYVAVSLLVGTLTVQTMNVTVSGNSNKNVTLTWDTSTFAANKYTLTVQIQLPSGETNVESNSQTLSQEVGSSTVQPVTTPPTIDPIILAIIAGVVVVAAAGAFLVLRRRRIPTDAAQPVTK